MNIELLIGLRLESCRLSKSSYTFEFDGNKNGKHYNFNVGTSCYLTFTNKKEDSCKYFSNYIWDMLETDLINVIVNSEKNEIKFLFENNKYFKIWKDESLIDNLLSVYDINSGLWFDFY